GRARVPRLPPVRARAAAVHGAWALPGDAAVQGARSAGIDHRDGGAADRRHSFVLRAAGDQCLRRRRGPRALSRGERAFPPRHRGGLERPEATLMVTQRQLIRRYFLVSFLVLAGGLMASGLVEMYFRYHEV